MNAVLGALHKRLDAMSQRERLAVFVAAALVVLALVYVGGIEPALQGRALLNARIADQANLLAAAQAQQQELTATLRQDPNAAIRERIAARQQELAALDLQLSGLQRTLVAPDRMATVLEELIGRNPGVSLVSLRNLPAVPLLASDAQPAAGQAARASRVYRHGVEIVVEGSYFDVLGYLSRIERQPWQMYWGRTVMTAEHPKVVIALTLYTLSLDRAWLVV
jgi:MSHA biogenesis protein MshJ